jgi:DNA-binding transcriptional ArsR family regulator
MKCISYDLFFRNFANPERMRILLALKEKPLSVGELSVKLKGEQSRISHALAPLKHCSLVQVEQKGKQRVYSLNKQTTVPLFNLVDRHTNCFCKNINKSEVAK